MLEEDKSLKLWRVDSEEWQLHRLATYLCYVLEYKKSLSAANRFPADTYAGMDVDSSPPRCMSFNEGEGNFCDLTYSLDGFYFGKRSGVCHRY